MGMCGAGKAVSIQSALRIPRVVNDADDDNGIMAHSIKNPVLAMNKASNAPTKLGMRLACSGIVSKKVKGLFKTVCVSIGNLAAKCRFAIIVNLRKVSPRSQR
jgi:hypothetical protein